MSGASIDLGERLAKSGKLSRIPHLRRMQSCTYSTTIGSTSNGVVLELEILIKDGRVELHAPVEAVAYPVPIRSRL